MNYMNPSIKKELALISKLFSQQISGLPFEKEGGGKNGYIYNGRSRNRA